MSKTTNVSEVRELTDVELDSVNGGLIREIISVIVKILNGDIYCHNGACVDASGDGMTVNGK